MANVKLNPILAELSGAVDNIVFFSRYKKQYARVYVTPANPDTVCQKAIRGTFARAVKSWQELPENEKAEYNRKARYMPFSGYNLYISRFMKFNIHSMEERLVMTGMLTIHGERARSNHKASLSVITPFLQYNSPGGAYMQREFSPGMS